MQLKVEKYSVDGKFVESFDSIIDAAKAYGVDESAIRKAAKRNGTSCGFRWKVVGQFTEEANKRFPKILILDIETAPIRAYVWQLWKQDVHLDQIISDWFMLTWSAKWLNSNKVISSRLTGTEAINEDDERIVKEIWNILDEADIVVAHYGDVFDLPKICARFIYHGLIPPSPYKQIDTKKVASHQFGFSSNKLDALATMFGIGCKMHTEFELWRKCMLGNERSLKYMEKYNRQDVLLLEEVYLKLLPYIKSHPNYNVYMDTDHAVCSHCGCSKLTPSGYYYTFTGKYKTYRCDNCGAFSRERKSSLPKGKQILTSIPGK